MIRKFECEKCGSDNINVRFRCKGERLDMDNNKYDSAKEDCLRNFCRVFGWTWSEIPGTVAFSSPAPGDPDDVAGADVFDNLLDDMERSIRACSTAERIVKRNAVISHERRLREELDKFKTRSDVHLREVEALRERVAVLEEVAKEARLFYNVKAGKDFVPCGDDCAYCDLYAALSRAGV